MKHRAYKFPIYPDGMQIELLKKTFGCTRFVYNYYLARMDSGGTAVSGE